MDFQWALQQLKSGKKVRRSNFILPSSYIELSGGTLCWWDGDKVNFSTTYLEATDWQLYDDSQQKDTDTSKTGTALIGNSADTSLTTELSVSPSLAAKILKLAEKENKRTPRKSARKARSSVQ